MFYFFISISLSHLTCKNPAGSDVPWFASFKVPKVKDGIPTHENGLGYFYRDDNTILSEGFGDLNDTIGGFNPIYESLSDMYEKRRLPNLGYALFSDQPPDRSGSASGRHASGSRASTGRASSYLAYTGRASSYRPRFDPCGFGPSGYCPSTYSVSKYSAHLKGVMIYDDANAIYLVHSVPKFPPRPSISSSKYSFPLSGVIYGQSFLCMTINHSELEKIAESYLLERPFIYDRKVPSFTQSELPNVYKLLTNQWNKKDVKYIANITTNTQKFKLFGKSRKLELDIYHDLIAPGLKADTYSSTWSNGVGTMDSDCSGSYKAYNVLNVSFGSVEWPRSKDHSKWAVAGSNVCIGGINRQKSQMSRGGDAFCIDFPSFAAEMARTITKYEKCPK